MDDRHRLWRRKTKPEERFPVPQLRKDGSRVARWPGPTAPHEVPTPHSAVVYRPSNRQVLRHLERHPGDGQLDPGGPNGGLIERRQGTLGQHV